MTSQPPPELVRLYGHPRDSGDGWTWTDSSGYPIRYKPHWRYAYRVDGERVGPRIQSRTSLSKAFSFGGVPEGGSTPKNVSCPSSKPCTKASRDYLRGRGWQEDEIGAYALSSVEDTELVVFPLVVDGEIIGWQGRRTDTDAVSEKYRGQYPGWACWGLDRMRAGQSVYVCEGIMDALLWPRGVAVLGTLTPAKVVRLLDRLPSRVVLCPDRDRNPSLWRAMVLRLSNVPVDVLYPPKGQKDFGSLLTVRK